MKVIHILHELKFSGAEIMYVNAAPLFQQKGCELLVLATAADLGEYAPYFEQAGYQVLHKPYPALKNYMSRLIYYYNFAHFIKEKEIDVVHIHSSECMWGMAFAAWIAKKRSVYTFHSVFYSRKITYRYHCLLRWSAKKKFKCKFQSISDSIYEHELKYYHNPTTKIYNWYSNNRFYPALVGEKEKVREELNISSKTFVLISIGGCNSIKRHSEIIKALPLVMSEIPDCIYLHLGKGISEHEEQKLSSELGMETHIQFVGNHRNVRKYLIASDIYLMTSVVEGIPITTIEAMACNIPTILYDVPGLRDFNKEEENSILIPENYNILAKKIIYLFNNPQQALKVAESANQLVHVKFSMENNVEQIFHLYE
jgi:glycosyltransferase involved in cell wall biosynthesis